MNKRWKMLNKRWTNNERTMNERWTNNERMINKCWTKYERTMNERGTKDEQTMNEWLTNEKKKKTKRVDCSSIVIKDCIEITEFLIRFLMYAHWLRFFSLFLTFRLSNIPWKLLTFLLHNKSQRKEGGGHSESYYFNYAFLILFILSR